LLQISDPKLVMETFKRLEIPAEMMGEDYGLASVPGKAFKSFSPKSLDGPLDLTVTLIGYQEDVLKAAKAKQPVSGREGKGSIRSDGCPEMDS